MNYRGISLLSCIGKLYSSLLEKRLSTYLEENDILADEQNGFRRKRSCEDHIFTLNSLVKNNDTVFTSYIDLRKCFDYIDRDMMLYKLLINRVDGKMFNSLRGLYSQRTASVRLNGKLTDWFECNSGLVQGDSSSPTIFSLFANDLVSEINNLDLGIDIGHGKISLLLYADDIVLICTSEDKLQAMLNTLHGWCKRWRVLINTDKSKCMHFRRGRAHISSFKFHIGNNVLDTVQYYKYLGVTFDDKCTFKQNSEVLSKAASRALGKIISKVHAYKEFGFKSFTKLYDSCVTPILDYCASVWGSKQYACIDNVQNRSMRYIMGVHRFTPTTALIGDTGWLPSRYQRWISMLRYWNRLLRFDDQRITKQAFNMDLERGHNNWCSDLKVILIHLNCQAAIQTNIP